METITEQCKRLIAAIGNDCDEAVAFDVARNIYEVIGERQPKTYREAITLAYSFMPPSYGMVDLHRIVHTEYVVMKLVSAIESAEKQAGSNAGHLYTWPNTPI